jgi:hypothetical protein
MPPKAKAGKEIIMDKKSDRSNTGAFVAIFVALFIVLIVGASSLGSELRTIFDTIRGSAASMLVSSAHAAEGEGIQPAPNAETPPVPLAVPGFPPNSCFSYTDALRILERKNHEAPVRRGRAANGMEIRLFTSPSGDTWTIVVILTPQVLEKNPERAVTCALASGEHWQDREWEAPSRDM